MHNLCSFLFCVVFLKHNTKQKTTKYCMSKIFDYVGRDGIMEARLRFGILYGTLYIKHMLWLAAAVLMKDATCICRGTKQSKLHHGIA